jgi:hypothetical protein
VAWCSIGAGEPVEGSAVEVCGQLVFANGSGQFFLRFKKARVCPVAASVENFTEGQWQAVSRAVAVPAAQDAQAIQIVVERKK